MINFVRIHLFFLLVFNKTHIPFKTFFLPLVLKQFVYIQTFLKCREMQESCLRMSSLLLVFKHLSYLFSNISDTYIYTFLLSFSCPQISFIYHLVLLCFLLFTSYTVVSSVSLCFHVYLFSNIFHIQPQTYVSFFVVLTFLTSTYT